jgi:hypothetical protein
MKRLFVYLVCLIICSICWYLVGWFVSTESDIFNWAWWGKLIYVFIVAMSTNDAYKESVY